jgi:5-methylcytosine-specific restriction endonuclease McrA
MKKCKFCVEECMKGRRYCFKHIKKSEIEKKLTKLKAPKKKKVKTEQQLVEAIRKKAVQLAKDISKNKDRYKCCYCGVGKPQRMVHSHHFFHEGLYKAMSADPDNLITLCASHHQGGMYMRSNDGFNFHNSPRESTEWFIEHYPERYKILLARSKQYQKLDRQFWENKIKELKDLIKHYESH